MMPVSVSVCEIRSVDQVVQDHRTSVVEGTQEEEEEEEEEVEEESIENKVGFLMLFKDKRWQNNTSSSSMWRMTY